MATALAAAQLQRGPQQEAVDAVVHAIREFGSSGGVRVRPAAALLGYRPKGITSASRGRICKVPLSRARFPKREALVSAMSKGEHDNPDVQETDKVSGEWWQPVLTAVHDWSKEKFSGLAELADGSLLFSFGGSPPPSPAPAKVAAQPLSQQHEIPKMNGSTHNLTPATLPQRQPSSFRKQSPIPATRKRGPISKEAPTARPPAKDKTTQKAKSPGESAKPRRPPSLFSKRSPIPKDRDNTPASASQEKGHSTRATPAVEAPIKATFSKRSPIPKERASTSASSSEKKSHATEEAPAVEAPAVEPPSMAAPATASDPVKDSPFSPELKEVLNDNKGKAEQEVHSEAESKSTDLKTSRSGPAKKTPSKPVSEDTEVVQTEALENGAISKDLASCKLPELRSMAKARGLKGYSKLKKSELVDLLAASEISSEI